MARFLPGAAHGPASYIDPRNGTLYPLDVPRWCSEERTPLLVTPGHGISRNEIEGRTRSLWRYRAALPVDIIDPITMGEGCTPLVPRPWRRPAPVLQARVVQPDRQLQGPRLGGDAVLAARQRVSTSVLEDSSGNGGASIAAYAAAGGMRGEDLGAGLDVAGQDAAGRAYGAEVELVPGTAQESRPRPMRQSAGHLLRQPQLAPVLPAGHEDARLRAVGGPRLRAPPTTSSSRSEPAATCSAAHSASAS